MHETEQDRFRRIPERAGHATTAVMRAGLCRRCGVAVQKPRKTFCSDVCVHEWKVRTNPGYAREQVEARDHCVCAVCGIDTEEARLFARRVRHRLLEMKLRQVRPHSEGDTLGDSLSHFADIQVPGWPADLTRSAWQMDHIVPVSEGGGGCDLSGLQTLCRWCHAVATKALKQRLASRRVKSS